VPTLPDADCRRDILVKVEHLSASSIKTYEQCPMRYYAEYELGVPEMPPHPLAQLGSAVHRMFELATKTRMAGDATADPFMFREQAIKEFGVEPGLHDTLDELTKNAIAWGYFRLIDRTVGCELEFDFLIDDGTKVVGFIDRLDLMPPAADIIDLKTQKNVFDSEELQNNWQARIYNIAVRTKYPEVTGKVAVSFWVLRHQVQRIWLTEHDANADRLRLIEIANEIRACKEPKTRPSGLCAYCPYVDCPARNENLKSRLKRIKNEGIIETGV